MFEDGRRCDSVRDFEESFKFWKFGIFVRGLGKVLLDVVEVLVEVGEFVFLMVLIFELFLVVLGYLGIGIEKVGGLDGIGFC